jgi:hypothetical protein
MGSLRNVTLNLLAFTLIGVAPTAFAAEHVLSGKHSQADIKAACNKAGGQLLGVSDSGSYGCEVESTGGLIICNKAQTCTAYRQAQTKSDLDKIIIPLGLKNIQ